jgi:predicted GIY-YIG superfamily endonuclease
MPYTLYVIELDPEVRTRKRFMAKNPAARPDKPSVYVGMTGRTAEQRFAQHKNGYKANRFARQFGIRLRKRLYANYQDIPTQAEALLAEQRLVDRLRKKGYAVWGGDDLTPEKKVQLRKEAHSKKK